MSLSTILAALAGQALSASAMSLQPRQSGASAFASNSDGSLQLSSIDPPNQGNTNSSSWNLSIDDTSSGYKQNITGFGAAITDATVSVFDGLDSTTLGNLLNELLTTAGADFSVMRHTIGASDLSPDPAYTYDDNNNNPDPNFDQFALGNSGTSMAKLIAQMQGVNNGLQILGSPWSAPAWMKLNDNLDEETYNNNLNTSYADQFAQYFVKYIQAYQALGAQVDFITIQNEPLNSVTGLPTMYVSQDQSAQLIQNNVGPALVNANLSTKVWAYDHNTENASYPETVVQNAGQYVDTVAWHCYNGPDWNVLTQFHDAHDTVSQYMTECYTPPVGQGGNWYDAESFTMGPLQNWANGVLAWTLGSDSSFGPHLSTGGCTNCQGLVVVDNGNYSFTPAYYQLAQFSRFMPRGAIVLNGTGSYSYSDGTGIQSVASLNPNGTRSVVINNMYTDDSFVSLNTTSGEQWGGIVPGLSTTTWLLPPVSS